MTSSRSAEWKPPVKLEVTRTAFSAFICLRTQASSPSKGSSMVCM